MKKNTENNLYKLLAYYKLNDKEIKEFSKIIEPIFNHKEFQRRLNPKIFPHHGKLSLGNHLLNDTVLTYIICKKKIKKGIKINIKNALISAMCHDLYELPWQNARIKKSKFINKHGFVHPIEAVINANIWFPEYFKNLDDAKMIIDAILHHMYPFPIRSIDNNENLELNNYDNLKLINDNIKNIIIESVKRNKIFNVSFSKSKYIEGKIISHADKLATFKKESVTLNSLLASITGINPDLDNY